jgi:superfamily II DNA/RNA helicase
VLADLGEQLAAKTGLTFANAVPSGDAHDRRSKERQPKVTAHIVVGTPGKMKDWLQKKVVNGKAVRMLVLDEVRDPAILGSSWS